MKDRTYGTGHSDNLTPVSSIDVASASSVSELLKRASNTAFGGRAMGEAADVLEAMIRDKECAVVMTLSGAMTVAKQGLLICDMIEKGWVQAIVSTGALMAHGLVEGAGHTHFKYDPRMNDVELYEKGYDRVYDTLELEKNLDETEILVRECLGDLPEDTVLHSESLFKLLGKHLHETIPTNARAILKSAYEHDVPIYVPAFTDSELGLDVALMNRLRAKAGKKPFAFEPLRDLESYAARISPQKSAGIFTIGGGVPRNWAQQLGPMVDIFAKRMGEEGHEFRFRYAARICPEPVHWGGLSGCTYSEGVSWGKFVPQDEGGMFAEVPADATIVWPILIKAMHERLGPEKVQKELQPPDAQHLSFPLP